MGKFLKYIFFLSHLHSKNSMIKFVKKRVKMFLRKMRRMLITSMKIMKRLIILLSQTSYPRLNCKIHFHLYKSTKQTCDIPETKKMLIVLSKHSTITLYFFANNVALKTFSNIECYKNLYDSSIFLNLNPCFLSQSFFIVFQVYLMLNATNVLTLIHIYENIF